MQVVYPFYPIISVASAASITTCAVVRKMHCSREKRFLNSVNELSVIMVITRFTWPLMTSPVIEWWHNNDACTRQKRHLGNMLTSVGMNKNINTNLILKSLLLNILNRHTGVIAQTWTENIKNQPVRWVCGIHENSVSEELFNGRVSQNIKHFQWMYLGGGLSHGA